MILQKILLKSTYIVAVIKYKYPEEKKMKCFIRYSLLFVFFCYVNLSHTAASTIPNSVPACAQAGTCQYNVSTLIGNSDSNSDGPVATAGLCYPYAAAFDSFGSMYISDVCTSTIRKIDANNNVTTAIKSIWAGALALDSNNNLYVFDKNTRRILKYSYLPNQPYTNPTIIAGNDSPGTQGYATKAVFNINMGDVHGLIVDTAGNIYFSDPTNHIVQKISVNGDVYTLSTIAGTSGSAGYDNNLGNNSNAVGAKFNGPTQLSMDGSGNIYVADGFNHVVRKLTLTNGTYTISTVAGTGTAGYSGDGGPAKAATMNTVWGVAIDSYGNIFISDAVNNVIRLVSGITGNISTIAGTKGTKGFSENNGTAVGAQFSVNYHIIIDNKTGVAYVVDSENHRIRKLTPVVSQTTTTTTTPSQTTTTPAQTTTTPAQTTTTATSTIPPTCPVGSTNSYSISTFAGNGNISNTDGPSTQASFGNPHIIVADSVGNFYVADSSTASVRKIDPAGNVTTIITGYTASALLIDSTNTLYVVDYGNGQLKKYNGTAASITAQNAAFTIIASNASTAGAGFASGAALNANLRAWGGLVIDAAGNLYMNDNNQIKKLTPPSGTNASYTLTTIAGTAQAGFADGPCATARFNGPEGMVISATGNLYVADKNNHIIRKIDLTNNGCTISTIAGTPSASGYSGDCGVAQSAKLNSPTGVTIGNNNIYIADAGNHVIRYLHWNSQIISTIAGPVTAAGSTPSSGYNDNNGQAIGAQFNSPWRLTVDAAGNVYITDGANHRIRKLTFLSVK